MRITCKTPASGPQPGQEKRESKREKRPSSSVDAAGGKGASSMPDEAITDEKRSLASYSSDASLRATYSVTTKNAEGCVAPLDGSQSQGSDPALPTVGDHAEAAVERKITRFKKAHKAHGSRESCSSHLQVDGELVLKTADVGSKRKKSLVGKEGGVSRSADADPDEKLDMAAANVDSCSIEKHRMEKKPIDISVKADDPSLSAGKKSRKNKREESIDMDTNTFVDKEVAGLTKGTDIGSIKRNVESARDLSSYDVKNGTSKRIKRGTQEGAGKSCYSTKSFQENVDKLSSQVIQNRTSVIRSSSLKTAHIGSVDKNDNEVPIRDNLVLLDKEEGFLGSTDADIRKKSDVSPDINLNSNEVQKRKKSRKNKNKNSGTNSVTCPSLDTTSVSGPSMPEIVEMVSERQTSIETSLADNLVSSVEKGNSGLSGSHPDATDTLPQMNANSDKGRNSHVHKKTQHKRKKKVFDYSQYNLEHDQNDSSVITSSLSVELQLVGKNNDGVSVRNDLNVTSTNSSSTAGIVGMGSVRKISNETSLCNNLVSSVEKENSGLTRGDSNKADMLPEIYAYSDIVKDSSSHVCKRTKHKRKKKVFDYSNCNSEHDRNDSIINSSVELESAGKNNADASDKNSLVLQVGVGCSCLTKIADGNPPDESGSSPKMAVDSFLLENPGSIQTKTAEKQINKSSNCCVCPSPIRGVVDDFALTELSNKQSNQLDLIRAEEVSFSFQIGLKVFMDKSSASQSEKACQSGSGVGSENGSPTVHTENALDSMSTSTHSETVDGLGEKVVVSSSASHIAEFAISSDVSKSEDKKLEAVSVLPGRTLISSTRKKLLVLDLNGLLADIFLDFRNVHRAHKKVGGKSVFKRPFCDDFLKFCFERFDIGVWSSRKKYNVEDVVDYLMGDAKHKLLFCWDQSRCTVTGFRTIENMHKPLVLKELKKLWNKEEPDLPWEKGEYSPSNTLLVDDSPYKALCNPPYTAIFPRPYQFNDEKDSSLGPGGDLRVFLEGLAMADDVQQYVQEHPFGQPAITATDPSWNFYLQVIDKIENTTALT